MRGRFRAFHQRLSGGKLVVLGVVVFVAVLTVGLGGPPALRAARQFAATAQSPAPARFVAPVYFRNCAAAHAAGVYSIRRGEPGYRDKLDADGDGLACEPYFGR